MPLPVATPMTETTATPLDAEQLEAELDRRLDDPEFPGMTRHRPLDGPVAALRPLDRVRQELALDWVERLAAVHEGLGFQFAQLAADALAERDAADLEPWLCAVMDRYDRLGLYAAMRLLKGEDSEPRTAAGPGAVALDDIAGVLGGFLGGLAGRRLRPVADPHTYTDGERAYLPAVVGLFAEPEANFRLYKAMAAHLWAQAWFGSFPTDLETALATHGDREAALAAYTALERLRLDACIARELPGLYREMGGLRERAGDAPPAGVWSGLAECLAGPEATAHDSLALVADAVAAGPPPTACYQGELFPERVAQARDRRVERERKALKKALAEMLEGLPEAKTDTLHRERPGIEAERDAEGRLHLTVEGRPMAPPVEVERLAQSLEQDLGELPADALVPSAGDAYAGGDRTGGEQAKRPDLTDPALHYDEWDHRRQHHRCGWCALREVAVSPGEPGFVEATLETYRPLVWELRRSFEALRGEERRLKRQPDGDEVDLDAAVEAIADARHGLEADDRLFSRRHKVERDIAVLFMVDMSGSTKGWINDAEREALVLLCDALERLGDRYAIYGFSGETRNRCEVFPVKGMDEPYDEAVGRRIAGIEPRDYTRMGAPIRHFTRLLQETAARTRLLVTLSDGKPDDLDGYYRGDYGIEDTRQALIEARRAGIHPFCITIDEEGPAYLPHMYGAVNYTVVDRVETLPRKVAEVYRRLTR